MIQHNIIVRDLAELKPALSEYKKECESLKYQKGVIQVSIGNVPESDISLILNYIKDSFPKMDVFGYSSFQHALLLGMESAIILSFTLMDSSTAVPICKKIESADNFIEECFAYAKEMNRKLKNMEDVKVIELYSSYLKASAAEFIEILTEGLDDICVFGAIAAGNRNVNGNDNNYITVGNEDAFVIADDYYGPGVSGIIFAGKDLYFYESYLFGWEPIGKYMDISAQTITNQGTTVVMSIDGMKPIDIYKKYLGVEPSDYFVNNIAEFPLVIERNGMLIGRTPSGSGPNGEVYLEGDLREDEKVRFSYAEPELLLNNTKNAADRMDAFGAERLTLVICVNRFNVIQDGFNKEIEYYYNGRKEYPSIILGMGEIYKCHGKGGIFNSALVAVGMREGLQGQLAHSVLKDQSTCYYHDVIPLSQRLSHFLKAMTGELVDAVDDAKSASNAKSEFLSNMSHEIRTPINAVLGMDEMILRECNDPQIQEYALNIKNAGNILLALINDVLDFSKIEAGKMDIVPVDYDFSSILNDLITMVKNKVETKGLKLIADIDETIPCVLNGDEIRIRQVVTNIMSNAIKYTDKGSITIKINYKKASEDEVDFCVAVKDTGIGIKEKDMDKLFNAFQRIDEKHNRDIQGSGLGLNITRKLLNLMGSELKVKSEYGRGSEFSFVLRQKVVKWDPVGNYTEMYNKFLVPSETYKEKFTAPDAEILVVDDTPINIAVFRGLLKKTLVQIDSAESGRECLSMTRQKKYDLIFLDHRMSEMDGIETLNALREDKDNPNNDTPAISLTANAVSGAREMYIAAGFIDYITKPVMSDKLEAMMINYLPKEKVMIEKTTKEDEDEALDELPSWIGEVEGIDKEEGLKNCGSVEMYIKTIESFYGSAESNYKAIEEFLKSENIAEYTIKVHSLKSSARIIGALELSKLAEELEHAGDAEDIEKIKDKTPVLLDKYNKIYERIKELSYKDDDKSLPVIGEDELKDALSSIKELMLNYDYDSIQFIMESLKGYKIPDKYADWIMRLKENIRNADWDKIKTILDEF
ncbi:MAG: response regulator [Butyrivibrio sp.]|uniref:ATP-binding protein n=1 Tax=Butyrivibrio sp. TaxID=28121 RepID=UPI0025F9AA6C|nr:ATP-binding protein [Butyrivibrio sp.]MCR5771522.1 response regulator [Butyrivibrio sp.]